MPLDEEILGFSNRWYKAAIDTAQELKLEPNLNIRVVTAPYFCATKIEAFRGRGNGDYLASHDLEDLVTVMDGRPELLGELHSAPDDVVSFVGTAISQMLETQQFVDALPGHLRSDATSQGRLSILLETLRSISTLR